MTEQQEETHVPDAGTEREQTNKFSEVLQGILCKLHRIPSSAGERNCVTREKEHIFPT